jgi:methylamine--corrinoid protein Co-methyltransferase
MAASRPLDVFEAFNRFNSGKKVREDQWDYVTVPSNALRMKEKYGIQFGKEIIPTSEDLADRLFQAGMDMLVTNGIYNSGLGKVLNPTEDEILEAIRRAPRKIALGYDNERVVCESRHMGDDRAPVIEAGPTGSPVSESVFTPMIQSYAQEPAVDCIVSGILDTVRGQPVNTNTPLEVRATVEEIRYIRDACAICGRPGLCI